MELAALSGIKINDFWDMTIAELNLYANAFNQNRKIERSNTVLNALLTSRWVWAKKITERDINSAMGEESSSQVKKEMTDEEMAQVVIALNKAFGGEVNIDG